MKVRECDKCRFCCWSFGVHDIPDEKTGLTFKPSLTHCQHECAKGCGLYPNKWPSACKTFLCPYLEGANIYRPDTFQFLKELDINIGNFIPSIHPGLPIKETKELIIKTRTIPASILVGNKWVKVIMALDRAEDKSWTVNKKIVQEWEKFYKSYDVKFYSSAKKAAGVKII